MNGPPTLSRASRFTIRLLIPRSAPRQQQQYHILCTAPSSAALTLQSPPVSSPHPKRVFSSTPPSRLTNTAVSQRRTKPTHNNKMPLPPNHDTTPPPTTKSLPRILCLHGGGVNAAIFHSQMRAFLSHASLSKRFRFVFVDAPFECAEGVGVFPVYKDWGPFRRWFRWLDVHERLEGAGEVHRRIWGVVKEGMEKDEGTGEWVGIWGFSQGAKMVGSLLMEQQMRVDAGEEKQEVMWKFGVMLAGRCPFAALSDEGEKLEWLQSAAGLPGDADLDAITERPDMKLRVPTVHVHGLRDEGLELHRRAVQDYCAPGTTAVVELDINHRVPIKTADVNKVVDAVVELVDEYGL